MEIKPKLIQLIKPLQIDQETCTHAIALRSLEKLPEIDSLIAATAVRYNVDCRTTFIPSIKTLHALITEKYRTR